MATAPRSSTTFLGICLNDTEDRTNPQQIDRWRSRMTPLLPPEPWRRVLTHSRVLSCAWLGAQRLKARRGFIRYYQRLYRPDYSGWRRFSEAIDQFARQTADAGIPLVAAVLPLMSHRFEKGQYPFEYAHAAIRRELEARGIDTVDALETFRGRDPNRMMAFPRVDPHPSEIAHRLIAETLFLHLLSSGYIPGEHRLLSRDMHRILNERWRRTAARLTLQELFLRGDRPSTNDLHRIE
jgi:hypothetical protein